MGFLASHHGRLSDQVGQEAFRRAICGVIQGGETVLDLGSGTGIHTLVSCQAGAARVYAIEGSEIIHLAEAIARVNSFAAVLRKDAI